MYIVKVISQEADSSPPLYFSFVSEELERTWKEEFTEFLGARANIESIGDRLAKVQMYIGT